MLASVIGGILGGSDDEAEEAGREEEEGSDEEGSGGEDEDDEGSEEEADSEDEEGSDPEADVAAEPASAAADPFSRKRLQEKAAAGADAGADGAAQRQRAEPEEGATVFIRGLPLDVSKEQVFTKMKVREGGRCGAGLAPGFQACGSPGGSREVPRLTFLPAGAFPAHILCPLLSHSFPPQTYGPVRSCRLVVDKTSGKLKGTAFVDFYKVASAEKAAEACAKGRCA